MKTFGKLLIGFIFGAISALWIVDKFSIYLERNYDRNDLTLKIREIFADYTRNLGYDVKDIEAEKDEFKFGFH